MIAARHTRRSFLRKSAAGALALGRDKVRAKYILAAAGIPTPEFAVVEALPVPRWRRGWPAIVKPAYQDASVGIDQHSVVTSQKQLDERVKFVLANYGAPVLIERFISGREFGLRVRGEGLLLLHRARELLQALAAAAA